MSGAERYTDKVRFRIPKNKFDSFVPCTAKELHNIKQRNGRTVVTACTSGTCGSLWKRDLLIATENVSFSIREMLTYSEYFTRSVIRSEIIKLLIKLSGSLRKT